MSQETTNVVLTVLPTWHFILIGVAVDCIILCMVIIWEVATHKLHTAKHKSNTNRLKVETSKGYQPLKNANFYNYRCDYMECLPLIGPDVIITAKEKVAKTYSIKPYGKEATISLVNIV